MNNIIEILNILRETSGNDAIEFLKTNSYNDLLKEILFYTYNPNFQYGIKEAKFNKCLEGKAYSVQKQYLIWENFKELLDKLSCLKAAKNEDVIKIFLFIKSLNSESEQELCKGILFKTLHLGCDISTFNKVWNDFSFDYPYLGATGLSEKNINKIKYPCLAQMKEDGLFCNAIIDLVPAKVQYISRQGKPLALGNILDEELVNFAITFGYDKLVFTGEIRILAEEKVFRYLLSKTKDEDEIKALRHEQSLNKEYLAREIGNGLLRDEKRPIYLNEYIVYKIWDFIPWHNFINKEFKLPCVDRFKLLLETLEYYDFEHISIPEHRICNSYEEIMEYFNEVIKRKEEGLVIKNYDSIWKDTKSSAFKVKAKEDCDLQIIDFIEGKGALENACGAVYCKSSDNKLFVNVKPRTPDLCKYIWNHKEEFLNKILCVEYNEKKLGQDKVIYTLNHPVWVEIRDDKDIADILENIK